MRITVTISRQLGCGGSYLGQCLAENLGIRCLDREIVSRAAQDLALDEAELSLREERGSTFWERMLRGIIITPPEALYHPPTATTISDEDLMAAETEVMKGIAAQEDCVIVGRLAAYVLPRHPGTVNLFLHAPLKFRIGRVMAGEGIKDEAQAKTLIKRSDETRRRFISQMVSHEWDCAKDYHLALDTSSLPLPEVADMLTNFVRRKTNRE
jgi:cytidylate kinase